MVTLQDLRAYMRGQVALDRNRRSVQVTAPSIEEGLREASIELDLPVKKLEFEVLEKGSGGLFGFSKRDYVLTVYEAQKPVEEAAAAEDLGVNFDLIGEESESVDRDGEVIVRLSSQGVLMKVNAPVGRGQKASLRNAIDRLHHRGIEEFDQILVSSLVKEAGGEYVRVGEFSYNPANDSLLSLDVKENEMKAYLTVQSPGPGGIDQSFDSMVSFLRSNQVLHGMKEEVLRQVEDHPRHNQPILVAEGTLPRDGEDARIIYSFDSDRSKIQLKERNGRVDFKEMNLVQNVVEGQILAKKKPPGEGTPGRNVRGLLLQAKGGKDVEIGIGKNVTLSEDGMVARSVINGQVIVTGDKINVEPVYVVQGDVSLKTGGNVIFLGTVYVKGGVDDGFKVKASGNIEVAGNVGKAEIDAEGDVIVHQGITGKGGGSIRAGKSVWAKFIENANVESGEHVVASEGIINTRVFANRKIVCQGKRATIVGGNLKAAEEIHAKTLGSIAGSETLLEVGYDPHTKERLAQIEEKVQAVDLSIEELNLNIHTLENLQRANKDLPEEKAAYLEELLAKKEETAGEKQKYLEEIRGLQEHLSSLKIRGKVSASFKVFPGVKISIKDAHLEVRNEFNAVTFINEANVVKMVRYEEMEEEIERES